MTAGSTDAAVAAQSDLLDGLCPLHLRIDAGGVIRHAGPTLRKLCRGRALLDRPLFDVFDPLRPRGLAEVAPLLSAGAMRRLQLRLRAAPQTRLKGELHPCPGGAVINLSFGIALIDAVRDHALTGSDFAATDLAIELLYLVEAKSAAMEASRLLNTRLQGAMIAAEERAFTDTLTGLRNRRALDHVLTRMCMLGGPFALMHLDLDFFKEVNDSLGHAAGDHVLQEVARIMVDTVRQGDIVARVGGDEFVLVFDRLTDRGQLAELARRLIARLERPIAFGPRACRISASAGLALHLAPAPDPARAPGRLLDRADRALYAAKRAGRGRHVFYDPACHDDPGPNGMAGPVPP